MVADPIDKSCRPLQIWYVPFLPTPSQQLVAYPILRLDNFTRDLHWYLRQLEQCAITMLNEVSGLHGERLDGMTGVWVRQGELHAKVAAIGVRASR